MKNGKSIDDPIRGKDQCAGKTCSVPECGREQYTKGLCRFHDGRKRNGGFDEKELTPPKHFRQNHPQRWVHQSYYWISVNGRDIMEHRHIMQKLLGRTLGTDEVVHHKDGNKLNNDPNNLEVLSREGHTSGHRTHQTPCRICGSLEPRGDKKGYKGARGLCDKHYQQWKRGDLA